MITDKKTKCKKCGIWYLRKHTCYRQKTKPSEGEEQVSTLLSDADGVERDKTSDTQTLIKQAIEQGLICEICKKFPENNCSKCNRIKTALKLGEQALEQRDKEILDKIKKEVKLCGFGCDTGYSDIFRFDISIKGNREICFVYDILKAIDKVEQQLTNSEGKDD